MAKKHILSKKELFVYLRKQGIIKKNSRYKSYKGKRKDLVVLLTTLKLDPHD